MKTIIIGTGAAGFGSYLAIKKQKKLSEAIFYNYGKEIISQNISYKTFPSFTFPQKKEFGEKYSRLKINNSKFKINYGKTRGGLSDFWSGSVFPFSIKELKKRKLLFLKKYYQIISENIAIIGNDNKSNKIHYKYRLTENLKQISSLNCFDQMELSTPNFDIYVNSNRVLSSSTCIYCGDCFKGCEKNVIFRPIKNFHGAIIKTQEISNIKKIQDEWFLFDENGKLIDKCKRLFLALGTFQTIKLLNQSRLINYKNIEIYDSNAISFPIKIKSTIKNYEDNYGYANKIFSIYGKKEFKFDVQISILPFNHFFTYSIFGTLFGRFIQNYLINNYALGMFFSSAIESNTYKINSNNEIYIKNDKKNLALKTLKTIIKVMNNNSKKFKIINFFKHSESSIHYSSNLLSGNIPIYKRSEFKKNLYIIDGNLFPGKPASNGNTLSILAGAYAITEKVYTPKKSNEK
jgi:hypothetical protein